MLASTSSTPALHFPTLRTTWAWNNEDLQTHLTLDTVTRAKVGGEEGLFAVCARQQIWVAVVGLGLVKGDEILTAFHRCMKCLATSRAAAPSTNSPMSCQGIRGVWCRSTMSVVNNAYLCSFLFISRPFTFISSTKSMPLLFTSLKLFPPPPFLSSSVLEPVLARSLPLLEKNLVLLTGGREVVLVSLPSCEG
ncbi:hypothetical protein E2C01_016155 [Portunus trituberculatus]|uniref:Uncharacterized protein n=1 Tax=Portunus trituberculatus TaxID=210409 RepID=A0A5B7DQB7_PORTR|nr:hypothetical protein [Portunus trituberculatus]